MTGRLSNTKMPALIKALDSQGVKAALKACPELLDYRGKKGENLLHLSCAVDIVKHRLPANDGIKTARVLLDPKALLECGADPKSRDSYGKTALHYMLKKRSDPAYVQMFLAHGARPRSMTRS